MSYKWKPSKTARREFAQKMNNDVDFANQYNQRQIDKANKRRDASSFDYNTAGGNYTPTQIQYDNAMSFLRTKELTDTETNACNMVITGYTCNEKVHHDNIHIVNELIRKG